MSSDDISLDRLAAFLAVFDAGGFSAASERLKVSKNAISSQISNLESELGFSLFVRTTRKVVPTDEGIQLFQLCSPPLDELRKILSTMAQDQSAGEIRITAPPDYTNLFLGKALVEFGRQNPNIRITLMSDDKIRDLVGERIDLAVRLGWLKDSSLRAVKIGEFAFVPVASPQYLESVTVPTHPSQLYNLNWIELSALTSPRSFRFEHKDGRSVTARMRRSFSADTQEGVMTMVRSGAGIALATDFSVANGIMRGQLVRVLEDWSLPPCGIYLTWPNMPQMPPRLRKLIDFLKDKGTAWLQGAAENTD